MVIVVALGIIGVWSGTNLRRNIPRETREVFPINTDKVEEKCLCGGCNLDIFTCDCPTARKQRELWETKRKGG